MTRAEFLLLLCLAPSACSNEGGHIDCDFPVGKPDAEAYYDAHAYGRNEHLGSDWNGVGGGHTDLGDPVFAMADGVVTQVHDFQGGWGRVVRVVHSLDNGAKLESLYAHLDSFLVKKGATVRRGEQLGTIGTAHGQYWAHLHFELRTAIGADIGGGYGLPEQGQVDPTAFIKAHRPK